MTAYDIIGGAIAAAFPILAAALLIRALRKSLP